MSETIADIVGDIRSRNQGCPLDAEGSHPLAEDMLALADRIEQAVTNCNQPEPVTNCNSLNAAKMREVLDEIRVAAMSDYEPDADYLIEKCNAALSAPPRNCDRFGSWREANAEWWKYEVLPRVEGVVSGTEQPFEEWLFAKAKESLNK